MKPHDTFLRRTFVGTTDDYAVSSSEVYETYTKWQATDAGGTPVSMRRLLKSFKRVFPKAERERRRIYGRLTTIWVGITFK